MLHFSRFYIAMIALVCALCGLFALPNFFAKATVEKWPSFVPHHQLALGLDLRGGSHLLLAMDVESLRKDWLANLREDVRKQLRDAKLLFTPPGIAAGGVNVRINNATDVETALRELRKLNQPIGNALLGTSGSTLDIKSDGTLFTLTPTEPGFNDRVSNAISAALETVRRRIDFGGTVEPLIVRQGRDRILVQVPGVEDTAKLKEMIGSTAKLTFHEVNREVSAQEAAQGRVPAGYKIYPSAKTEGAGSYVLKETPVVSGEDLVDSQQGFDQRNNEAVINFRFNQKGARTFGRFTSDNVGRPFAIVLDNEVLSAPVIRSEILGGSGQISGNFTVQSANDLAVKLRSGALPAKLTPIEERTVGASLGQDSIDAGIRAAIVGAILVSGFMIFAYGLLGLFAVIGAAIHIMMVIAMMTAIGSTMTLPGIAGIVLTIGMAVDANVLINERIREELRAGRTPISAIEAGFTRAYATIVDSQLTTFIAGLVMFWLGSGPIRGFAVTLTLGIITTVFTAFTIARLLVVWWIQAQKGRRLEAPMSFKPTSALAGSAINKSST